jgi:hypothetical protein
MSETNVDPLSSQRYAHETIKLKQAPNLGVAALLPNGMDNYVRPDLESTFIHRDYDDSGTAPRECIDPRRREPENGVVSVRPEIEEKHSQSCRPLLHCQIEIFAHCLRTKSVEPRRSHSELSIETIMIGQEPIEREHRACVFLPALRPARTASFRGEPWSGTTDLGRDDWNSGGLYLDQVAVEDAYIHRSCESTRPYLMSHARAALAPSGVRMVSAGSRTANRASRCGQATPRLLAGPG